MESPFWMKPAELLVHRAIVDEKARSIVNGIKAGDSPRIEFECEEEGNESNKL